MRCTQCAKGTAGSEAELITRRGFVSTRGLAPARILAIVGCFHAYPEMPVARTRRAGGDVGGPRANGVVAGRAGGAACIDRRNTAGPRGTAAPAAIGTARFG